MKLVHIIFCIIIVSTHVSFNLAKLSIGTYADPNYPGKCVVQQLVMEPGTVAKHPEICAKVKCRDNSKASIVSCPEMIPPPDCKLGDPISPESNYPNCCRKRIVCKNGISFNS